MLINAQQKKRKWHLNIFRMLVDGSGSSVCVFGHEAVVSPGTGCVWRGNIRVFLILTEYARNIELSLEQKLRSHLCPNYATDSGLDCCDPLNWSSTGCVHVASFVRELYQYLACAWSSHCSVHSSIAALCWYPPSTLPPLAPE